MTSTSTLDTTDTPVGLRRPWRRRAAFACAAAAAGVGATLLISSSIDGAETTPASPTVPVAPMSADALERWLEVPEPTPQFVGSADAVERDAAHIRETVRAGCAGTSADATERCLEGR